MYDNTKISDHLEVGQRICEEESNCAIQGKVIIKAYERGKLVPAKCRERSNIFLLEGRKYDAQVKSYASYTPLTPVRNDRIRYIGFGAGTQPLVSTIQNLVTPVAYNVGGDFLATLDIPTFSSDFTIVTYTRTFTAAEISFAGTVEVSECGLYTDGISPTYAPGTRPITLLAANSQVPVAYNTFEPLGKTADIDLVVRWELRHN